MTLRPWMVTPRQHPNLFVFVGVLLVVGAVFGALLVNALTLEQQQELADELGGYAAAIGQAGGADAGEVFRDSLLFYGKWLALIWLLGVSVIGVPAVLALDFLKGVLIGFAVGLLVRQLAWKGVLFSLAAVAPQNAIVVPALLIASVSATRFAHFVVRERLFRRKGLLLPPFLAHTAVTALMLVALCAAALYEAYVSPALLKQLAPLAGAETLVARF